MIARSSRPTRNGHPIYTKAEKKFRMRGILFLRQKGKCKFCDQGLLMAEKWNPDQKQPDNLAVLLHLDSRFSRERGGHPGELRRVLVCRKCADERSKQEQICQPIEDLHERSGRAGQNLPSPPPTE